MSGRDPSAVFDSSNLEAATISSTGIAIVPTIRRIGTYSTWILTITDFPLPLELGCFVRLTVPSDLGYEKTTLEGLGMFSDTAQFFNTIGSHDQRINANGENVIEFEACKFLQSLGANPNGRLEINRISTPKFVADTGEFKLEIFKDSGYNDKIA